jgi:hypothetical protein
MSTNADTKPLPSGTSYNCIRLTGDTFDNTIGRRRLRGQLRNHSSLARPSASCTSLKPHSLARPPRSANRTAPRLLQPSQSHKLARPLAKKLNDLSRHFHYLFFKFQIFKLCFSDRVYKWLCKEALQNSGRICTTSLWEIISFVLNLCLWS